VLGGAVTARDIARGLMPDGATLEGHFTIVITLKSGEVRTLRVSDLLDVEGFERLLEVTLKASGMAPEFLFFAMQAAMVVDRSRCGS
jgi:hypothetical protein